MLPARHLSNGAEHFAVENEHDDARNVKGRHRRADEKVRVVERTHSRCETSAFSVVHT